MFDKRKKENAIQALRIAELEEILCPCGQHDFVKTDFHFEGGSGRGDELTIYHYVCKRCKKKVRTWKLL